MTRKKLVVSGDSWTAGSVKQRAGIVLWPDLLAEKLNMECVNVAKGGRGNEVIYNNIIDTLCTTKNIGLSICMWSSVDRWDFFEKSFEIQPQFFVDQTTMLERGIRWFHAFQNHCVVNGIPFLQIQSVPFNRSIAKELIDSPQLNHIDESNFIGWPIYSELGGSTVCDKLNKADPEMKKLRVSDEDTHPNTDGHKLMAELLYEHYRKLYV